MRFFWLGVAWLVVVAAGSFLRFVVGIPLLPELILIFLLGICLGVYAEACRESPRREVGG
ncbi:hypothetical protein LCGC14_0810940 [marine sediment metagenome]|uniref:Uncharacterized protein n=1 Tax=marine sediment metagenome TaxID=412755 RepID=A0A0F9SU27_9ZZZZ